MAHLIQDGFVVNDHTWKLGIFVTDLNISKDIYVRGDTTIGTVMMNLVDEIGMLKYFEFFCVYDMSFAKFKFKLDIKHIRVYSFWAFFNHFSLFPSHRRIGG